MTVLARFRLWDNLWNDLGILASVKALYEAILGMTRFLKRLDRQKLLAFFSMVSLFAILGGMSVKVMMIFWPLAIPSHALDLGIGLLIVTRGRLGYLSLAS